MKNIDELDLQLQEKERVIIEIMASVEHTRWAGWQEYFFSKCVMKEEVLKGHVTLCLPEELWRRWGKQIHTKYADLSEKEKESDRVEARTTIAALEKEGFSII